MLLLMLLVLAVLPVLLVQALLLVLLLPLQRPCRPWRVLLWRWRPRMCPWRAVVGGAQGGGWTRCYLNCMAAI
jgi:hypothetical protein